MPKSKKQPFKPHAFQKEFVKVYDLSLFSFVDEYEESEETKVWIEPKEISSKYKFPTIGKLYEFKPVNGIQTVSTWQYPETIVSSEEPSSFLEIPTRLSLEEGEVILCLDYIVAKLERGYELLRHKNKKFVSALQGNNIVYAVGLKALHKTRIIYKLFLITFEYNEFFDFYRQVINE